MQKFTYIIKDAEGIHARPAGQLVNVAKKFESEIILNAKEKSANMTRIMAVMSMGVKHGDEVEVMITGPDEKVALEELQQFFANNL